MVLCWGWLWWNALHENYSIWVIEQGWTFEWFRAALTMRATTWCTQGRLWASLSFQYCIEEMTNRWAFVKMFFSLVLRLLESEKLLANHRLYIRAIKRFFPFWIWLLVILIFSDGSVCVILLKGSEINPHRIRLREAPLFGHARLLPNPSSLSHRTLIGLLSRQSGGGGLL